MPLDSQALSTQIQSAMKFKPLATGGLDKSKLSLSAMDLINTNLTKSIGTAFTSPLAGASQIQNIVKSASGLSLTITSLEKQATNAIKALVPQGGSSYGFNPQTDFIQSAMDTVLNQMKESLANVQSEVLNFSSLSSVIPLAKKNIFSIDPIKTATDFSNSKLELINREVTNIQNSAKAMQDLISQAATLPTPSSQQIFGFAAGIIDEIKQNGKFTSRNKPSGHKMSGITPSSMASRIAQGCDYPGVSSLLLKFSQGVCDHITANAVCTYALPVPVPPFLLPPQCWFIVSLVTGISGSGMAASVISNMGYPFIAAPLLAMCTVVATYIMATCQVVDGNIT